MVEGGTGLPLGRCTGTPAEWAQLHAGIEFIHPPHERDMMILSARGWAVRGIADLAEVDEGYVREALSRVARTLTTWERNACAWATRFVAVEPWSEDGPCWRPGDAPTPSARGVADGAGDGRS